MRKILIASVLCLGLLLPVAAEAACGCGVARVGCGVAAAVENGVARRQCRREARQAARQACAPAAAPSCAPTSPAVPRDLLIERRTMIIVARPLISLRGCPCAAPVAAPSCAAAAK